MYQHWEKKCRAPAARRCHPTRWLLHTPLLTTNLHQRHRASLVHRDDISPSITSWHIAISRSCSTTPRSGRPNPVPLTPYPYPQFLPLYYRKFRTAWRIWRLGIARIAKLAQCALKFLRLGGVSYIPPPLSRFLLAVSPAAPMSPFPCLPATAASLLSSFLLPLPSEPGRIAALLFTR